MVTKYRQNPVRAARALAVVHIAIEESLVRAERAGLDPGLHRIAAHAAAGRALDFLYPREVPGRTVALALIRSGVVSSEAVARARRLGEDAAREVVARAMRDGSHRVWDPGSRPEPAEGQWRAAPPLNLTNPVEPLAGQWTPWNLPDVDALRLRPPIPYESAEFWREAGEVLEVSRRLTPEHKRIADDWNLDLGTVTPAGVWNLKALELARRNVLGERETARLLAALNTAMADAFIACWREKFRHWSIRPVNAIRERFDASFLPYLLTPAFPSYPSGHATASGAAAEVLARALPMHASEARSAAAEAAMSRLYGGIHFESDNREGLRLGQRIGAIVADRFYGRGAAAGQAALAPVGASGIEDDAKLASTNAVPQRCAAARLAMRPYETLAAGRPTIRWDAVPGADRYRVQVTSRAPEAGNLQSTDTYVESPRFQPPLPLTDTTAIVDVSVQADCAGEPGPASRTTFFVDTRLACPSPQLDVEAHDGQFRVRWDRTGPAETAELRAFAGPDASLRAQATLTSAEGAETLDSAAPVIVAVRRRCEGGFSEFSFVRVPG